MKRTVRNLSLALSIALTSCLGTLNAQPLEVQSALPAAVLSGSTRFTSWGFDVYEARLWVEPGFRSGEYERHAFSLELKYLRDFTNEAITERSIDEIRRLPGASQAPLQTWRHLLRSAFPDVRKGDRITGIHRPGEGVFFFTNGRPTGAIRDPEFGRLFFGIWLSEATSEPQLRRSLLSGTAPRV